MWTGTHVRPRPRAVKLGVRVQRVPTVSALCLSFELAAYESFGLDVERMLGLAGLSRERVLDPRARFTVAERIRWLDAAREVSGDPALGLKVGATIRPGVLGSFEYMLRHTGSLEEVLARANEYMRLVDDASLIEVARRGDRAVMRVSRKGGHPIGPAEMHSFFSACLKVLRSEWSAAKLFRVAFSHPAPCDEDVFVRFFGCPVAFAQPFDEVEFDAAILARGPSSADRNLGRVLEEHVRHQLAELPEEDPFLASARAELRKQIEGEGPSVRALARALRTSERTLRRRLDAEGTSYHALLDGLRAEMARGFVGRTREGFEAIASRLAFADASTFFHAFKRWTGMTPAQFRQARKS
jgi:AraC-like DNA-binding protein